jgi:hypothetical protein
LRSPESQAQGKFDSDGAGEQPLPECRAGDQAFGRTLDNANNICTGLRIRTDEVNRIGRNRLIWRVSEYLRDFKA